MDGAAPIDASLIPDVARLVEEVTRAGCPRAIQQEGQTVALLILVRPGRAPRALLSLVDTTHLPPVPHRGLAGLIRHRQPPGGRRFTDEEIESAVAEERAERREFNARNPETTGNCSVTVGPRGRRGELAWVYRAAALRKQAREQRYYVG